MTQSLAGITDVEARLGRSLTADELNSIDGILSDISSLIRRYTGRNFTKTTVTKRFRPVNAEVRLPGKPISEIVDARYVDWYGQTQGSVSWFFDGIDHLYVYGCGPTVEVEYVTGTQEVPDDVVAICVGASIRRLTNPTDGTVQSERAGEMSISYAPTIAAAGNGGLLHAETQVL